MALRTSELQKIKFHLGYHLVGIGGEPWISYVALFEQVIAVFLQAGAATTSSTTVAAQNEPTPVTITLASASGFAANDRVIVDVDSRQEVATVQSLSGSNATVLLSLAHTGTYPVELEGGEGIIRELLNRLDRIDVALGEDVIGSAGVKRVDEIEFFGPQNGVTRFTDLRQQRDYWRDELAAVLGIVNLRKVRGGQGIALY